MYAKHFQKEYEKYKQDVKNGDITINTSDVKIIAKITDQGWQITINIKDMTEIIDVVNYLSPDDLRNHNIRYDNHGILDYADGAFIRRVCLNYVELLKNK